MNTVLNLIQRMEKIFSILKNACFSGKGHQLLRINIMRIHKMLISCVKLDHALYSINYGNTSLETKCIAPLGGHGNEA